MNYMVSELSLTNSGVSYPLFKISPPSKRATEFIFVMNHMAYLFPTSDPQKIYKFDGVSMFELIAVLDNISGGEFNEIPYNIAELREDTMFVIVPAEVQLSTFKWNQEPNSKSAIVYKGDNFQILKTVYDVQGNPPTAADYPNGPNSWNNRYGDRRKFFKVAPNKYAWQDKTTKGGKITSFSSKEATTIEVAIDTGFILAAATNGDAGKIYYILIEDGKNPDKKTTR